MERLGFGYDVLQINPRIIYASSSGYGQGWTIFALLSDGSHGASGLRGHGAHWLCRYATSQSRTSLSDFISGIHLYAALVTALLRRERTGKGCMVEVAMHDAMYPTSNLGSYYDKGLWCHAPPIVTAGWLLPPTIPIRRVMAGWRFFVSLKRIGRFSAG